MLQNKIFISQKNLIKGKVFKDPHRTLPGVNPIKEVKSYKSLN
jgi:hypothetical protein